MQTIITGNKSNIGPIRWTANGQQKVVRCVSAQTVAWADSYPFAVRLSDVTSVYCPKPTSVYSKTSNEGTCHSIGDCRACVRTCFAIYNIVIWIHHGLAVTMRGFQAGLSLR